MSNTLMLKLLEAEEQAELENESLKRRKSIAAAMAEERPEIDRDYLINLAKETEIPQDEIEQYVIDFATNYAKLISYEIPEDIDQQKLQTGTEDEMKEHNVSDEIARKIALDHLTSDPTFYDDDTEEAVEDTEESDDENNEEDSEETEAEEKEADDEKDSDKESDKKESADK